MRVIPSGVPIRTVGSKSPLKSVRAAIRHLNQRKPDVVITNQQLFNSVIVVARMFAKVKPKLIIVQRNDVEGLATHSRHSMLKALPIAASRLWPMTDAIVAISSELRDDLATQFNLPLSKTHVIYNPVIGDEIATKQYEDPAHPWFNDGEPPVVLTAGNLNKQKDQATLIRAFALVRNRIDCRLLILGEGDERPNLEALIRELGLQDVAQLYGFTPNPFAFMSRAGVFVLSSAFEGLGNVVIEALACGAPVVSTSCKSGPSEILENGKYGRLVPVGDERSMAEAICQTLGEAHDPARLRARAQDFTEEASMAGYIALIHKVLER